MERNLNLEICSESAFKKLMSILSNPLILLLMKNSYKTWMKGLPKYLSSYGWNIALYKARNFWAKLDNSRQLKNHFKDYLLCQLSWFGAVFRGTFLVL